MKDQGLFVVLRKVKIVERIGAKMPHHPDISPDRMHE